MASLQDRLRQKREGWFDGEEKLVIPGYGGTLVARYRQSDWEDTRDLAMTSALMVADVRKQPASRDIENAVDLLLAANVGLEAHDDGRVAELKDEQGVPLKLGKALAVFIGADVDGVDTDRQALMLKGAIFETHEDLFEHAMELANCRRARRNEVDDDILKN